jgi:hypothetical protein
MKAERSSAKEEDGEFMHEKANEEGVPSAIRVPAFTHSPGAWEPACTMPGPATLSVACVTNDKGDPSPPVSEHGSNR